MKALGGFLTKAGLVVASTTLALLVFEAALWLVDYQYTPLRIEMIKNWSEWRYHFAFDSANFVYDSELIWRPRENTSGFNEQGFRGKLLTSVREAGTIRIFAIGDSNTLGWVGEGAPNWPMYLQDLLNQNGHKSTVINAGVYGYTVFQGLRRFKKILAFKPDIVLISFGCNDAAHVTMSDAEFASRKIRRNEWDNVLVQARVGQLILSVLDRLPGAKKETLVPRVTVQDYKSHLAEIIRIARAQDIEVILLTRPFTGSSPPNLPLWWKNFAPEYNAATVEAGRENDTPVIDVYSFFEGCNDCFADESHFTEKGVHQMAELIYDKIHRDAKVQRYFVAPN